MGGGQLARMLAQAALPLGVAVHVQTPAASDPAAAVAAELVLADPRDGEPPGAWPGAAVP